MATRHLPVQALAPAPRVIHYPDPAQRQELLYVTAAQVAARQHEQRALYARWLARQTAIAERDRKVRRFWLGFGAVVGTAALLALGLLGWLAWHAVTASGLGLLAVPLAVVAVAGLVVGGHRCITVVQHWH